MVVGHKDIPAGGVFCFYVIAQTSAARRFVPKPGKYRIIFYRKEFLGRPEYEKPLKSNMITIEVTDNSFRASDLKGE